MNMSLYTIYDKKAEESGPVFMAVNDSIASRNALSVLIDLPRHIHNDYDLVHVGEYNTCSMALNAYAPRIVDISDDLTRMYMLSVREVKEHE